MTFSDSAPKSATARAGDSALSDDVSSTAKPLYWRSLSELRGSDDFSPSLEREFPVAASEFPDGVSRRRWMKLMGASMAMAGVAGCRYPEEEILPFVIRPEGRVPGETYLRTTNFEMAGRVYNLLVSNFDGRPLKIEPNPDHPGGGGTDVYSQASILGLYDPDRARGKTASLLHKSGEGPRKEVQWDAFDAYVENLIKSAGDGAKFAVLMSPTHSPTTVRLINALKKKLPKLTIAYHDSVGAGVMRAATTKMFGKPANQALDLEQADVVVTLQADVLGADPGMIASASSFSKRRDPLQGKMNRLYVVEGGYTITGASADTRLPLQPSQMMAFLGELDRRVDQLQGGASHDHETETVPFDRMEPGARLERFLDQLAHDVVEAGEKAVVVVGDALGADAIAAGIALNKKLGSLGKAIKFTEAPDASIKSVSLAELIGKVNAGGIDSLLILANNPAFSAPGDLDLAATISDVRESIYLGEYDDETSLLCDWSLPLAHPLESWGDVVNPAGLYGVCQPQILPLLGGRSVNDVLAGMLGETKNQDALIRDTADSLGESLSHRQWNQLLHDGHSSDVKSNDSSLAVTGSAPSMPADAPVAVAAADKNKIEVLFTPADGLFDGRFANNGWLQEMPHALTKMCWDNAAVMGPQTAAAFGVHHGLSVAIMVGEKEVILPVYEMPGMAPGVLSVAIGYGRTLSRESAVSGRFKNSSWL